MNDLIYIYQDVRRFENKGFTNNTSFTQDFYY